MSDAASNGNAAQEQPPRRYLAEFGPGEQADDVFVISQVQLRLNKNGDPYLQMNVGDKSRSVRAMWWDQGEAMYKRLPNPGVVRVKGKLEEFNGSPQIKVEKILQIRDPSRIDYTHLLPSTDKDVDAMFAQVRAMLEGFESPTLRSLAGAYLADEQMMANFRRAPAAQGFHHAFLGGLLDHTLNAMKAADALARLYPGLNRELCVFGVFVHDLAKTWELSYETAFDYTDGGRLVGHIVKSAMWLEDKARAADREIPRDVVDVLQHMILSHHGELSLGFGSAKSPATPEAIFVHHVENLDAKMTMALAATRWGAPADDEGRWTPFQKAMGERLFKPDVVAEADAGSSASAAPAETESSMEGPPEPSGGQSSGTTPLFPM